MVMQNAAITFDHDGFTLNARIEGKVVGYLKLDTSDDVRPTVSFIYVEPEFRRRNIGLALCFEAAQRLGKMGLRLYAAEFEHEKVQAGWKMLQEVMPERVGSENGRMFLSYI